MVQRLCAFMEHHFFARKLFPREIPSMAESFFSAGALKKARPGRTRILPERRFCDAAAPGNMPSGYEKRPRNNAASEVFVGSGRHVPEHRFGDLGVGIEIEVAGRGREHTPGREVMAAPVGGVQLFNADGGTCGRAVDEARSDSRSGTE